MVNYYQDFEKLFRESSNGLFFHFLSSVNNGTLTSTDESRKGVLTKYQIAMGKKKGSFNESDDEEDKVVHFIIASMSPKFLLHLTLSSSDLKNKNLFSLEYRIVKKKLTFSKLGKWKRII